jgi:hypothetical protein
MGKINGLDGLGTVQILLTWRTMDRAFEGRFTAKIDADGCISPDDILEKANVPKGAEYWVTRLGEELDHGIA